MTFLCGEWLMNAGHKPWRHTCWRATGAHSLQRVDRPLRFPRHCLDGKTPSIAAWSRSRGRAVEARQMARAPGTIMSGRGYHSQKGVRTAPFPGCMRRAGKGCRHVLRWQARAWSAGCVVSLFGARRGHGRDRLGMHPRRGLVQNWHPVADDTSWPPRPLTAAALWWSPLPFATDRASQRAVLVLRGLASLRRRGCRCSLRRRRWSFPVRRVMQSRVASKHLPSGPGNRRAHSQRCYRGRARCRRCPR